MNDVLRINTDWHQILMGLELTGQDKELARNLQVESCIDGRLILRIAPSLEALGYNGALQRVGTAIEEKLAPGFSLNIRPNPRKIKHKDF